jgi:hypothetical protein
MKKLAILINVLKVLISLSGVLMLIGWLVAPTFWAKPLSYLATIVLPYVPNLFKLAKIEFSLPLTLAYELFLVVAMVLGIDLNWYGEVLIAANNDSYYDKIVHFSSGVLVAAVGQELFLRYLRQSENHKTIRWFQALFIIGCVALVAVGWECYEFLYDQLCGGNMQELVKSGVSDTMWDMIVSMVGGVICTICIIYAQKPDKITK